MTQVSIGAALHWLAEAAPDRVAVRDGSTALTRRELDLASDRLARAYRDRGVGLDDVVALGLPNGVELVVAVCAVWKAGATPLPLSARLPSAERRAVLELVRPRLLVGAVEPGWPSLLLGPRLDAGQDPLPDLAAASWKASLSGGSTGRAKVVLSTSPALVEPGKPTASYVPADAVQLVAGPLDHGAPFLFAMRGLLAGHTLVVLPRFDAAAWLGAVQEHRVTWGLLVPTMMQRIWRLAERESYDVSSIGSVLHLGAPCPEWLKREWLGWLGPERVWELYAGTESTGVTLISGPEWLEHPGSVGRAAPGFAFRVQDAAGREVPPGVDGEVWMQSTKTVGATYRYVGGESRAVDGWDTLGDIGHLDAGGWLHLTDRADDLVLVGGSNVWPAEVEAVLDEHPAVGSSAVFGVPDEDLGEVPVGLAQATGVTAEELLAWVAERLDRVKVPRALRLVDHPLRDDAGKLRRRALREAWLSGPG